MDRHQQRSLHSYDEVIEVSFDSRRGIFEVPGAAEPEDAHGVAVALELDQIDDRGPLRGWDPWERHFYAVDVDGCRRHYFARNL